jgi:hypothetical protein
VHSRRKRGLVQIAILAGCYLVIGCSYSIQKTPPAFDRPIAQQMLTASNLFLTPEPKVPITYEEAVALENHHYLAWSRTGEQITEFHPEVTPQGKAYFDYAEGKVSALVGRSIQQLFLYLQKPIPRVFEKITGITNGGPDEKVAEYEWYFKTDSFPPDIRSLLPSLGQNRDGRAIFRLYDDGWRLMSATK